MKTPVINPENQAHPKTRERHFSSGDLIVETGRFFLGAPYREGTLEGEGREKLIVNLHAFDCTTFVETVLALVRCAASGKLRAPEFRRNLQYIRYRGGKIDGYASRLHYFTDWLANNQKKKVLKDISRLLGGARQQKEIHFMTTHREQYAALTHQNQADKMRQIQRRLSRKSFYVIGRERVSQIQDGIQPGDIIAFTTNQEGLDVAHVGFAVRERRRLRLLHASRREGAVVVSAETLPAYLRRCRNFTGILVARFF
jgi:cell wall-associated NlpC family hydrolase